MDVVTTIADLRAARASVSGLLGFVPTMGYLHAGHMALVERACRENTACWVSIFVNPLQFGPTEDLARYPRDLERDLGMLRAAGVDVVFTPTAEEVYPPGFDTYVEVTKLTERLEGAVRPGHFRGVTTVVCKLFNLVQPHRAYFGRKDAQQFRVIRKMVQDLNLPIEIVPVATVREPDGLALSSRNVYLNPQERQAATVLYRALREAERLYLAGERDAEVVRQAMLRVLQGEPLVTKIDYVSVAADATLEELATICGPAVASLAVRIGSTRLIDNIELGVEYGP